LAPRGLGFTTFHLLSAAERPIRRQNHVWNKNCQEGKRPSARIRQKFFLPARRAAVS
jgi:hypothetical protein